MKRSNVRANCFKLKQSGEKKLQIHRIRARREVMYLRSCSDCVYP